MMKVFVWHPTGENTGHASVQIDDGRPRGTAYASWWPQQYGNNWWFDPAIVNRTYVQDFQDEGGEPSVVELRSLNETASKTWWNNFRLNPDNTWTLATTNCAWVTYKILEAGLRPMGQLTHRSGIWEPLEVLAFARWIQRVNDRSGPIPPGMTRNRPDVREQLARSAR